MRRAKEMFLVTGPWSFAMSAVAITAGTFVSSLSQISPAMYLLALLMVVPIHASANLLNDCYDVMTGADRPGALVMKPHPILTGLLTLRSTTIYAGSLMALGLGSGLVLVALGRPYSLAIVAAAVVLMLAYNVPPLRLKERGLGEVLVFLVWGPLMFLGAHYLQTDSLALEAIAFSVPAGLLVASVLLVDDARDLEEDKSIGRTTIATLLGRDRAIQAYGLLVGGAYVADALAAVVFGRPWLLVVLLSAPAAFLLARKFARALPPVAPDRTAAQLMVAFELIYAAALAV